MKIELNFNIQDLDGKEIENANAGKLLASALVNNQSEKVNIFKFFEWAMALNKGQVIDLDTQDQGLLKEFISSTGFPILSKAQMLKAFDKAKPEPIKKAS